MITNYQTSLRLPKALKDIMQKAADREGRTVNNWIERTIIRELFAKGYRNELKENKLFEPHPSERR